MKWCGLLPLCMITGAWAQFPSTIDLSVSSEFETAGVTRFYGENLNDRLADDVAFGDLNGDGYDETIMSSESAEPSSALSKSGMVYIHWGGPTGHPATEVNLREGAQIPHMTQISGRARNDNTRSVKVGDIDGDGFGDLIIGAVNASNLGVGESGEVTILFGSFSFPTSGEFSLASEELSERRVEIVGTGVEVELGWDMATGDVNADGLEDLIVSAPSSYRLEPVHHSSIGAVIVLYGGLSLTPGSLIDLGDPRGSHSETWILGDDPSDQLGFSLSCADMNGDGFDDVVAGTRDNRAIIVYGASDLPQNHEINLDLLPGIHGETRVLGTADYNLFGRVTAIGDINGDGCADMVTGELSADPLGRYDAGQAVVLYGRHDLSESAVIDLSDPFGTHGESRIYGSAPLNETGQFVECGDLNGDGFDDVLVTTLRTVDEAGLVSVLYGRGGGLPPVTDLNTDPGDVRILGSRADDWLTSRAVGGDVDRNGIADFALSALKGDNPFFPEDHPFREDNLSGIVYLFPGDDSASSAMVSRHTRPGDGPGGDPVPAADFGPVVRVRIDYSDDDLGDDGAGEASLTRVTLMRSDAELDIEPKERVADVH